MSSDPQSHDPQSQDPQAHDPLVPEPRARVDGPDFVAPESSAWAEPLDPPQDYPSSATDTAWMNSESSRYSWTNPLTGGDVPEPRVPGAPPVFPPPSVPAQPTQAQAPRPAQAPRSAQAPMPLHAPSSAQGSADAPRGPSASGPYSFPRAQPGAASPAAAGARPEKVGAGLAAMLGAIVPGLIVAWFVADVGIVRIVVLAAMVGLAAALYRVAAGGTIRRGRGAVVVVLGLATMAFWAILTISPWWAFGSALELGERASFSFSAAFSESNLASNLGSLVVCLIACGVALSWTVFRPGSGRGVR